MVHRTRRERRTARLQFGRVFRRMGLPFWTFLGIGLSGVFVNYVGLVIEVPVRAALIGWGIPEVWAEGASTVMILLLVIAATVAVVAWHARRSARSKRSLGPAPLPVPQGKRGLILLVSRLDSAMYAIRYHYAIKETLECVWLIPSNNLEKQHFGEGSAPVATEIEAACHLLVQEVENATGVRRELQIVPWKQEVSPADAQDTFELVNRVYRIGGEQLGLDIDDIVADFTGGTKPMSVGMIMACLQADRSLEYVAYNPQTGQVSGPFTIDYQHSAFDLIG